MVPVSRRFLETATTVVFFDDFTSGSIDPSRWKHAVTTFGGGVRGKSLYRNTTQHSTARHSTTCHNAARPKEHPSKHAGSDSEAFWLRPACNQNWAGSYNYAGPDLLHLIRFPSSKQGPDYTAHNRPALNLADLVRFWSIAFGLEASWCAAIIGAGAWRNAAGPLPVLHFHSRLCSSTDGGTTTTATRKTYLKLMEPLRLCSNIYIYSLELF